MPIHFLSQLKLIQTLCVTLYKLNFCTFSPPNLQEKGMGSYFLTSYVVFWLHFREYLCWCFVFFFFFSLWVCFIFFFFFGLSLFVLLRYCSYANLFRLIDSCIIICWFLLPILFESNPCGSFVFSIISFAVNLVWSHWLQCD